jgi:hypothetical protein
MIEELPIRHYSARRTDRAGARVLFWRSKLSSFRAVSSGRFRLHQKSFFDSDYVKTPRASPVLSANRSAGAPNASSIAM